MTTAVAVNQTVTILLPLATTPAEFAELIGTRTAELRDRHAELEALAALLTERFGIVEEIPVLTGG